MRIANWLLLSLLFFACNAEKEKAQTSADSTPEQLKDFIPSSLPTTDLVPFRVDKKWGYADKDGNIVIEPKYEQTYFFSDSMARVRLYNRDLYLNHFGEVAFKMSKDVPVISDFKNGLMKVVHMNSDGLMGFMNKKGELVIDYQYSSATDFQNGLAIVGNNKLRGAINIHGDTIIPFKYKNLQRRGDFFTFQENGLLKLMTQKEEILTSEGFKFSKILDAKRRIFSEKKDKQFYIVHANEKRTIPLDVHFITYSTKEQNTDYLIAEARSPHRYILYNLEGKMIKTFPDYQSIYRFSEGAAAFGKNGKYGFIDSNGDEIIPPIFEEVSSFSNGLARIKENDKYGFINQSGKIVIPCNYLNTGSFDKSGHCWVTQSYKWDDTSLWGIIDKTGKFVFPLALNFNHGGHLPYKTGFHSFINGEKGYVGSDGTPYFINKKIKTEEPKTEEKLVSAIRQRFQEINESVDKYRKESVADSIYQYQAFFDDDELQKMVVKNDSIIIELYYEKNVIVFAYFINIKNDQRLENRYYFDKSGSPHYHPMFRWINDSGEKIADNTNLFKGKDEEIRMLIRDFYPRFTQLLALKKMPNLAVEMKEINQYIATLKAEKDQFKINKKEEDYEGSEFSFSEKWVNQQGKVVYTMEHSGADHGSEKEELYFKNGKEIFRVSSGGSWHFMQSNWYSNSQTIDDNYESAIYYLTNGKTLTTDWNYNSEGGGTGVSFWRLE